MGHKIILAHILVKTIDEFKGMNPKGMNPKDAVQYIEGEPYISRVPVDAGSTNVEKEQNGEKVIGLNSFKFFFSEKRVNLCCKKL